MSLVRNSTLITTVSLFFYVVVFVFTTLVLFVCRSCPLRASVFFVAYRIYRETQQKIHSSLYLFWYLHLIPLNSLFYKAHVCGCFLSGLWLYIHTGFRIPTTTTPQKRTYPETRLNKQTNKQTGWGLPNNDIFYLDFLQGKLRWASKSFSFDLRIYIKYFWLIWLTLGPLIQYL